MNGWIKLYRKIWESKNFKYCKNKANMILVWVWLLTHADENGVVTFGRKQVADDTGISESSIRRALLNIIAKMEDEATIEATKLFTRIQILNWHEYQDKPTKQVTDKRPTTDQQPTTNKNIRIKEDKNIESIDLKELQLKFPRKMVYEEFDKAKDWLASTGKRYKDYHAFFRNWLRRCPDLRTPPREEFKLTDDMIDHEKLKQVNEMKQNIGRTM